MDTPTAREEMESLKVVEAKRRQLEDNGLLGREVGGRAVADSRNAMRISLVELLSALLCFLSSSFGASIAANAAT